MNFGHGGDGSVGFLEHIDLIHGRHPGSISNAHEYDPSTFDSQYTRYAQILDSDFANYVVLYQCLETAEYIDTKTQQAINGADAFAHTTAQALDFSKHPFA